VESAIDRISLERHELSRCAKDSASAAVLLSIVIAVLVWTVLIGAWLF
jgi:diacylglycerol kinase (ATP)